MAYELAGSLLVFSMLAVSNLRKSGRPPIPLYLSILGICWLTQPLMACFVFGMIFADCITRNWSQHIINQRIGNSLAVLLLVIVMAESIWFRDNYSSATCAVLAGLFVLVPIINLNMRQFFQSPTSRFLGRISFPLYLTHGMVICSLSSWLTVILNQSGYSVNVIAWIVIPITIIISIGIAVIFEPVESIAISWSHRISKIILRRKNIELITKPA
jgi:peptidoglycan/LPS O-acetylase OafA/YrhL